MITERRLEGQAALITGAGSGIGRAIAVAFAREGARVGINYCRNAEGAARTLELVRGEGAEGALVRADVSSAQVHMLFGVLLTAGVVIGALAR